MAVQGVVIARIRAMIPANQWHAYTAGFVRIWAYYSYDGLGVCTTANFETSKKRYEDGSPTRAASSQVGGAWISNIYTEVLFIYFSLNLPNSLRLQGG